MTRSHRRLARCLLTALLAACGEPELRATRLPDSVLAARRRAFLASQDSLMRVSVATRRWMLRSDELEAGVMLAAPTLIAFHPSVEAADDSLLLAALVDSARAAAADARWTFGRRWTGEIEVRDPDWQAHYEVRPRAGGAGLLLLVPGRVPEVLYGLSGLDGLRERLSARGRGPADGPNRRGAPL